MCFPAALDSVCVFSNRQFLSSRYGSAGSYLNSFPAPLPVLGVVGQPPQVHVRLDDLGPEDEVLLVLPRGDGLHSAVESEGLGPQLQSWGRRRRRYSNALQTTSHSLQEEDDGRGREDERRRVRNILGFYRFWRTTRDRSWQSRLPAPSGGLSCRRAPRQPPEQSSRPQNRSGGPSCAPEGPLSIRRCR